MHVTRLHFMPSQISVLYLQPSLVQGFVARNSSKTNHSERVCGETNAATGLQMARKCSHGTATTQGPNARHSWRDWNRQISSTVSSNPIRVNSDTNISP